MPSTKSSRAARARGRDSGGDSGIGRAVAVLYAREGADVAIAYLPHEQSDAEETRKAVEAEGKRCLLISGDVSDVKFCERTFRTNIFGYFFMVRAAVPHLEPGGAIVNTGSITGMEGSKELLDYSATKGAIHAFTKRRCSAQASRRKSAAYVFFASNVDSSYITGEVLTLLGGETTAA